MNNNIISARKNIWCDFTEASAFGLRTAITDTIHVAHEFGRRNSNLVRTIKLMMEDEGNTSHYAIVTKPINGRMTAVAEMDWTGFVRLYNGFKNRDEFADMANAWNDLFRWFDRQLKAWQRGEPCVWTTETNNIEKVNGVVRMMVECEPDSTENEQEITENVPEQDEEKKSAVANNDDAPMQLDNAQGNETLSIPDLLRRIANDFESFMDDMATQIDELKQRVDAIAANSRPEQAETKTAVVPVGAAISMNEFAKMMKRYGITTGEIKLYAWMRDNGYLCSVGVDYNLPTQKANESGLFVVVPGQYIKPNGQVVKTRTTRVTDKGQIYFVNKFLYNNITDI